MVKPKVLFTDKQLSVLHDQFSKISFPCPAVDESGKRCTGRLWLYARDHNHPIIPKKIEMLRCSWCRLEILARHKNE